MSDNRNPLIVGGLTYLQKDIYDEPDRVDDDAMAMRYLMLTEEAFAPARMFLFGRPDRLTVEEIGLYLAIGGRTTMTLRIKQWRETNVLDRQRETTEPLILEEWSSALNIARFGFARALLNMLDIASNGKGKTAVDAFNAVKSIVQDTYKKPKGEERQGVDQFISDRQLPGGSNHASRNDA